MPDTGSTTEDRWRVRHFAQIDSTNRYLLDEARGGAEGGAVAVADHQTAGRGRFDRRWVAPPGSSLLVSVLLRPAPIEFGQWAMTATALALAGAVEAVAGFAPELKWPNDLVVGDRKLAGLLAERVDDALVIGAGCNVEWSAFPPDLADTATACNFVAGRSVDRDALLHAFLGRLASELDTIDEVPERYRARLATLGRHVRVERASDAVEGVAVAVTDDGSLVVRDRSGTDHTITAGDVVHLR